MKTIILVLTLISAFAQAKVNSESRWPQLTLKEVHIFPESARLTGELAPYCEYKFTYNERSHFILAPSRSQK
jgi:hypothetical protein